MSMINDYGYVQLLQHHTANARLLAPVCNKQVNKQGGDVNWNSPGWLDGWTDGQRLNRYSIRFVLLSWCELF